MYDLYGVNEFIGPSLDYDMVFVCSDGIYGYHYEDDSKELIVSDDTLPKLGSNYRSAYLSGNSLYVALANAGTDILMNLYAIQYTAMKKTVMTLRFLHCLNFILKHTPAGW